MLLSLSSSVDMDCVSESVSLLESREMFSSTTATASLRGARGLGLKVVEGTIGTDGDGGDGGGVAGAGTLFDDLMPVGVMVSSESGSSESGSSESAASGSGHMCIVIVQSG